MASCRGRFEQLGHYFHPTSLLAHLGPVSRQNSTLQTRKEAVEKMNHPNFLCSSTEMEHPWRADWLSARWIYASTNLSGIFRLHAIQFATICADNQKAQVGTKDWTAPDEYTRQPTCLESLDSMPYSSLPYVPITKRHKLGPKTGLRFSGLCAKQYFWRSLS